MIMQIERARTGFIFSVMFLALLMPGCSYASAPSIDLPDQPIRLDDTIPMVVRDLAPHQIITLRGSSTDFSGRVFQSFATFQADENGTVDPASMAPLGGSYSGIDPMGLFWSMDVPSPHSGSQSFDLGDMEAVEVRLDVISGRDILQSRSFHRVRRPSLMLIEELAHERLVGTVYRLEAEQNQPAVIVLGGSEGGIGGATLIAEMLASRGYVALALSYFTHEPLPNHPNDLAEIPLEYFLEAISWLESQPFVDEDRLALIGGSKGAEAALLVGGVTDRLRRIVAISPPSVVWQAPFATDATSSWSYQGSPLPYVRYQRDPHYNPPAGHPNRLVNHYRHSLTVGETNQAAAIPVEPITADILLLSGQDDLIWESAAAGNDLIARLDQVGSSVERRHLSYEHAGHSFAFGALPTTWTPGASNRWPNGGTPQGNAIAAREAWSEILLFLADM